MKIKVLLMVLLMAMAAGVSEGAGKKVSGNNELISKAKSAVIYLLKDPQSAQFRNVHVGTDNPALVRGEVNSKNSYGGYSGFERFLVDKDRKVFLQTEEERKWDEWVVVWTHARRLLGKNEAVSDKDKGEHAAEMKFMFEDGW